MPRQVQNYFDGLTAALQLKGQEPLIFPPELRGVIDLLPFLRAGRRESVFVQGNVSGTTDLQTVTVPDNEVWIVERVHRDLVAGQPTDRLQGQISYQVRGDSITSHRLAISGIVASAAAAGQTISAVFTPQQPFVALPGDDFIGAQTAAISVGATPATGRTGVLFSRFTF